MSDNESAVTDFTAKTDDTNFYDIQFQLQDLADVLEEACASFGTIESEIKRLEKPLINTTIELFNDPSFLESSPFREEKFALKPPGLPNIDIKKRYAYKDIVATIRNYVFNEKLVMADGTIRVDKRLAALFEISEKETTFLTLLRQLRKVLI